VPGNWTGCTRFNPGHGYIYSVGLGGAIILNVKEIISITSTRGFPNYTYAFVYKDLNDVQQSVEPGYGAVDPAPFDFRPNTGAVCAIPAP
jgi:hypothetical protein